MEALEYTNMDVITEADVLDCENHVGQNPDQKDSSPPYVVYTERNQPPSKNNKLKPQDKPVQAKASLFTFCIYFIVFLIVVSYAIFPNANTWNGFLYGLLFVNLVSNVRQWVLDHYFKESEEPGLFQVKKSGDPPSTFTIPPVKEYKPMKKYEVSFYFFIKVLTIPEIAITEIPTSIFCAI